MRTHRFVGGTSREVLHKVKQALGDDALILSNRPYNGGIEVVALAAGELGAVMESTVTPAITQPAVLVAQSIPAAALAAHIPSRPLAPCVPAGAPGSVEASLPAPVAVAPKLLVGTSAVTTWTPATIAHPMPALVAAAITRSTASPSTLDANVMTQSVPAAPANWLAMGTPQTTPPMQAAARAASADSPTGPMRAAVIESIAPKVDSPHNMDCVLAEMGSLKSFSQRDRKAPAVLPDIMQTAIGKSGVMHELLNAGFSARLSRQVADEVCSGDIDPTIEDVAECLERELWLAGSDEIINSGGVYALVGPTGVGKTTTVAKLAARAVVRFGARQVALLTTDGYRIGAHDQLRIYGRILSVPVHAIRDANDLATVLAELKDRHLILIDTVGVSQRDRMVAEHAAMLAGAGDVRRLLLVNTTANARTLEQVVTAYKKSGVDGCILTKTDEAASLAPALDVLVRHQLPLHFVTDGQRVPEDLQLPNAIALVQEALRPAADEDLDLGREEMLFMQPGVATQPAGAAHG